MSLQHKIKKEPPDYEIKEYAKTTIKEMLGMYGYSGAEKTPASETDSSGSDLEPSSRLSPTRLPNVEGSYLCCAWCQKVGGAKQFSFRSPNGSKVFCSEVCFTQCRRANFKRNKTCDWCRHVRHTVTYVDFQDGDHQLQFCSDKCLNQYKMNIFCKETQAQLELHPHIQDAALGKPSTTNNLITPDLWMRDCRSVSPDTDKSNSPPRVPSPAVEIKTSPSYSPESKKKEVPLPPKKSSVHREEMITRKKQSRVKRKSVGRTSEERASSPSPCRSLTPPRHHPPPFMDRHPFMPPGMHQGMVPPPHMMNDARFRPRPRCSSPAPPPPPLLPIRPPMMQPPPFLLPSFLPPPTTLLPYPILIPIPIPLPIPIPIPIPTKGDTTKRADSPQPASDENSRKPLFPEKAQPRRDDLKSTPLRKRKRMTEINHEDESLREVKTVHV